MGAQGTAQIDFGAFPGKSDASVDVTGQAGIGAGSLVEAWLYPVATADHSADEHLVETIRVVAGNIVPGTGFTIYAFNVNPLNEPLQPLELLQRTAGTGQAQGRGKQGPGEASGPGGGTGTRIYGQWTVAWVWN